MMEQYSWDMFTSSSSVKTASSLRKKSQDAKVHTNSGQHGQLKKIWNTRVVDAWGCLGKMPYLKYLKQPRQKTNMMQTKFDHNPLPMKAFKSRFISNCTAWIAWNMEVLGQFLENTCDLSVLLRPFRQFALPGNWMKFPNLVHQTTCSLWNLVKKKPGSEKHDFYNLAVHVTYTIYIHYFWINVLIYTTHVYIIIYILTTNKSTESYLARQYNQYKIQLFSPGSRTLVNISSSSSFCFTWSWICSYTARIKVMFGTLWYIMCRYLYKCNKNKYIIDYIVDSWYMVHTI